MKTDDLLAPSRVRLLSVMWSFNLIFTFWSRQLTLTTFPDGPAEPKYI